MRETAGGFLSRIRPQPPPPTSPNRTCLPPQNPRRPKLEGSTFAEAGAVRSSASTDRQRPRRTRDRLGPLASLEGRRWLQGHLPKATQHAAAEPDLPAVGGGGDCLGPSHASAGASPRGRGGAGPPGAAAQERALGKGGGGAPGAEPGRGRGGADFLARRQHSPAETWKPALTMKRPREPSGSDGESDGPIDVGREGELR